jgi:hypothetical protein
MTLHVSIFLGNYYIKIFSELNTVMLKNEIFSTNIIKKKKNVIYHN